MEPRLRPEGPVGSSSRLSLNTPSSQPADPGLQKAPSEAPASPFRALPGRLLLIPVLVVVPSPVPCTLTLLACSFHFNFYFPVILDLQKADEDDKQFLCCPHRSCWPLWLFSYESSMWTSSAHSWHAHPWHAVQMRVWTSAGLCLSSATCTGLTPVSQSVPRSCSKRLSITLHGVHVSFL